MTQSDASTVLQFRSSRQSPAPPGPRDITHVLAMRAGAPDDVPDTILTALAEASVFQVRLPGIGLGLVLDDMLEAALRDDGFELTRVAPEPGTVLTPDDPVVLPLRRALLHGALAHRGGGAQEAVADLHAAIDRLHGRTVGAPRADLQALCAVLLGAGTLAAQARDLGTTIQLREPLASDTQILDRLSGIEDALRALAERPAGPKAPEAQAQGN